MSDTSREHAVASKSVTAAAGPSSRVPVTSLTDSTERMERVSLKSGRQATGHNTGIRSGEKVTPHAWRCLVACLRCHCSSTVDLRYVDRFHDRDSILPKALVLLQLEAYFT